jgi:hypothetical protein
VDWICLAQGRDRWRVLVNSVLNLWVPKDAGKLPSVLTTWGLGSGAQLHIVSLLVLFSYFTLPLRFLPEMKNTRISSYNTLYCILLNTGE